MKFLTAHILTFFYCYIKFYILITIEIELGVVDCCLYFRIVVLRYSLVYHCKLRSNELYFCLLFEIQFVRYSDTLQ